MLGWWAHWRAIDTNTRTSLASITSTHTQHKEIRPFSTMQSLIPWSPFQCYLGVVEKKSRLVALSVWFSTHQVCQAPQALIHHSNAVRGQNHCMQAANSYSSFYRGKTQSIRHGKQQPTTNMKPQHPILKAIDSQSMREGKKDTAKEKCGRHHRPHSVGTHSTQLILNTIAVEFVQIRKG